MDILRDGKKILSPMTLFLMGMFVLGALGAMLGIVFSPICFVLGIIAIILLLVFSRDIRMIVFVGIPISIVLVIAFFLRHFFGK
jgi:hypothetical protein